MWCIPPKQSGEFVCHMEDVLEVYHRPYDPKRPVVCLDETIKQLIGEIREPLPLRPGESQRLRQRVRAQRHGQPVLAFEPLAGWRHVEVTDSRAAGDWAGSCKTWWTGATGEAEKIVLVMDNLNTHTPASLYEAFRRQEAKRSGRQAGDPLHAQARQSG